MMIDLKLFLGHLHQIPCTADPDQIQNVMQEALTDLPICSEGFLFEILLMLPLWPLQPLNEPRLALVVKLFTGNPAYPLLVSAVPVTAVPWSIPSRL